MQRRDDDDEALEPHADVDDERDDEQQHHVGADPLDPEELRRQHVAEDQRPVERPVRPGHAVPHHVRLVRVRAVPRHERFDHVAVGDDQPGDEQDLRHVVQMALGDEVLQPVHLADRNRQRQHHREARIDGAGDEVRRKDRGVPAGDDRHREVEAHDRVHRDDQRRREPGQQQIRRLVAMPVMRRAAPSHRQRAVDHAADLRLGPVAQRREVGNQADEPEQQRHRRVCRDREHVPDERAAELRPHVHRVRVGEQPVRRSHGRPVCRIGNMPRTRPRTASSLRRNG